MTLFLRYLARISLVAVVADQYENWLPLDPPDMLVEYLQAFE
jgi:hypothetical protein